MMVKKIINFFRKLLDSKDSSVNSKILTVLGGLFLLTVTTFLVLLGVAPDESMHIGDLIWGLVVLIVGDSAIEVANQFRNQG